MSAQTNKQLLIGIGLLLLSFGVFYFAYEERPPSPAVKAKPPRQVDWAFLAETKQLSETEDLRMVRIPSKLDREAEYFDKQCLIYRNYEFKTAHFWCPTDEIVYPPRE